MKCQHKGCRRTVVVECFKPAFGKFADNFENLDPAEREKLLKDHVEYYCPEHCQEHGYCWNCGSYQEDPAAFSESGLCPACESKNQLI